MERISVNSIGKVRRVELGGRDYFVAPLSMLKPGVLNGSDGPLMYTPEDTAKAVPDWNGMPITARHPSYLGKPVSARNPVIFGTQTIGTVMQATFNDGLKAEGWFDVERTKAVDKRIYDKLSKGEAFELSTGLFAEKEEAPAGSNHNGVPFVGYARNHKPDHLAVLMDERGACSMDDGCGVVVNATGIGSSDLRTMLERALVDRYRAALEKLKKDPPTANCGCGGEAIGAMPHVIEVYPKEVVFWHMDRTYQVGYKVDHRKKTVTLDDGEPKQVDKMVTYEAKREEGSEPTANCYAWVGDPDDPKTWRLRMDSIDHILNSADLVNREDRVNVDLTFRTRLREKLRESWLSLGGDEDSLPNPISNLTILTEKVTGNACAVPARGPGGKFAGCESGGGGSGGGGGGKGGQGRGQKTSQKQATLNKIKAGAKALGQKIANAIKGRYGAKGFNVVKTAFLVGNFVPLPAASVGVAAISVAGLEVAKQLGFGSGGGAAATPTPALATNVEALNPAKAKRVAAQVGQAILAGAKNIVKPILAEIEKHFTAKELKAVFLREGGKQFMRKTAA